MIDSLWQTFFASFFLFGRNWILLFALGLIVVIFFVIKYWNGISYKAAIKQPLFAWPAVLVSLIFLGTYYGITHMPPSKQEFVVVIPEFEGVTSEARKEAVNIRDRIVTELLSRQKNHRLKLRIVLRSEKLDAVFDQTEALTLGKHYGAHLVLSGKVRLDEQFYFEPVMLTLLKLKRPYEPFNLLDRLVVTPPFSTIDLLRLKEQKVRDISEVVVLILGLALYDQDKYGEAVGVLESLREPSSQASVLIGNCYFQMGQLDKALQHYDQAIRLRPDYFRAWHNKGMALLGLARYTEATGIFDQATKLKPDQDAAEIALTLAAKAACLSQDVRNVQEALTLADKAIALALTSAGDPSLAAFPFVVKAIILMTKAANESRESMLEMIKAAASRKDSRLAFSKAMLSVMYGNMEDLSQAVKVLDKAIAIKPESEVVWYVRGNAFFALGLEKEALEAFDRATKLKPDFWQAWGYKSVLLFLYGETRQAEDARSQANKYGVGKGGYAFFNGFIEGVKAGGSAAGRPNKAADLSEMFRYELELKECVAYDLIGQYQRGLWSCEKAIAIQPNRIEAWYFRGNIFRDKGEYQLAIHMYDRALEIDPTSLSAQYGKAYSLSILKRPQDALDLYDTIIKAAPDAGRAWEGRYYALIQLGRFKEAGAAYKKVAGLDPQLAEKLAVPF